MADFIPLSAITHCSDCGKPIVKPKRKCPKCRVSTRYHTTTLKPSRKGMKKTGLTLSKPDKPRTKRAKRQNTDYLGMCPRSL